MKTLWGKVMLAGVLLGSQVVAEEAYDPSKVAEGAVESKTFELKDTTRDRVIPLRVYLPADKKPMPVVLFSHGLGGSRDNNPYLGEHWAKRGYVVVFIQHPGSDESVWKDVPALERMTALREAASAENYLLRSKDVPAVLDALAKWNGGKGHPLQGRMDLEKIGMSGHSFGAQTTQVMAGQSAGKLSFRDSRIDAAVMMSPSPPPRGDVAAAFAPVKIPCLRMTGTLDDSPSGKSTPADFVHWTVEQMDRFNIRKALVGCNEDATTEAARTLYPDRFFFDAPCNPNNGMDEVRRIRRLHRDYGIKAISVFPSGTVPQVAINHKYMFPLYAVAVELDIPILLNVGIPGPRIPMETQKVEHLDEVCWFFPDLKVVMRHGAEPWEALAVKLMLKYPNLYYSTSAFAPKHYPKAIIDYANTRGADKIIYAGYFPMGLSLDRIFGDMPNVPFKADVWPQFLRGNAMRVFGLED